MAVEKSIVKMNKMIQKKTGESFLVVYVMYVSFVYRDSKKTASCLLPRHTIFATNNIIIIIIIILQCLYREPINLTKG